MHTHISRLRGAFDGAVAIVHRSDGYILEMPQADQAIDLFRFRALRDQARGAGDDPRRVALLTEALALWHGQPLSGLTGEWVEGERDRWQQERRATEHDLVEAQLSMGFGKELVASLSGRTAQHPLDERVASQYMLALHRAGRSADALDHYRRLRERLVDELGTEPGTALRDLHRQILAADPSLLRTPAGVATQPVVTQPVVTPRQLPAAPAWFVGRRDEMDRLDAALSTGFPNTRPARESPGAADSGTTPPAGMVLISAIGGAGGIGKTWLALTWAHHNLRRFPDGQLFVDLHGFSPTGQPAHPADVLGGFLDALGVDRDRQPADPDRRAELYRSLVADKQMLVMLDNAVTTDQVTPLLPGGQHCTVLVTSRNQLRGLTARHGARPINLDVLTDTEAHTLLTATLGPNRTGTDTRAVTELIELCGGFPLALGLITARAAADPHVPLSDIVAELHTMGLDALDSADPTASLPAVLSWSLHHLTDQQRRAFALLGIAPGPDIGLPAAAHLLDMAEQDTNNVLRSLADASLIDRAPGNRYGMHDLVRAYATDTAHQQLPDDVQKTALRRVLDFYTHTAYAADRLLHPYRDPAPFEPPGSGLRPYPLPDAPAALAWLDTEYPCLLAAQRTATIHQWHATVWHLAWDLYTFHFRRGRRHDQLAVWQAAADAATYLPDLTTRTIAYQYLGHADTELRHYEGAIGHLHQALGLAEHQHDITHQAHTHYALATAWEQQGDDRRALDHARHALDLYRRLDLPVREASALNAVAWSAARLRDYDSARENCRAALALYRDHHHLDGEAAALDTLGYIDHHSGEYTQAIDDYGHVLTLVRKLGDTHHLADTLDGLGHPHAALGEHEQARTAWQEALKLYREQGRHDDAARVQRQLDDLDVSEPPQGTEAAE